MTSLQLRPYQDQSIEGLRIGMRDKHIRQILCASTGAGKSIIMLSMIESAMLKGSKVLFLCERRILVKQFSEHLDRHGIDHGILMAGTWRFRPDQLVQVASIQTIERMEYFPSFDICFVDEIHAAMRKSLVNLIKNRPSLKIIGATATPFSPKIAEHFTNVVNVVSMKELINDGHLVPFRVFAAREVDTKGLKTDSYGEFEKAKLEERGKQIVGDVVADYIRLTHEVYGEMRKGICFSCGIDHGSVMAQRFNESGVNAVQISANDTDEFKADVLAEFAKPDTDIRIVISSELLERGYDQSDIDIVILAKPIKKSFSKFVQMIGRGARPHEGKEFCVLQDHGNNWIRFSEQWEELFHNGVKELVSGPDTSTKKEPTDKEKEAAKCPRCGCLWGNGDACLHCGFVREKRNTVIDVPGEMVELGTSTKVEKYDSAYKESFYQQLLGYARQHGYQDGYAYWKYKEKFSVGPSWKKVAADPSLEVCNWIKHLNIKQAKRKSA